MIEKNWPAAGWYVGCDDCSNEEEFERASSREETLQLAKGLGWRPRMERGEWRHICPVCLEEERTNSLIIETPAEFRRNRAGAV